MTNKRENLKISIYYNDDKDWDFICPLFTYINKFFNFNLFKFKNIASINEIDKNIFKDDFCFVFYSKTYEDIFNWDLYSKIHDKNKKFKLVFLNEKYNENDFLLFKNGVDDLIYLDKDEQNIKWKIFSLLRRRWDDSHNKNVLIHNGVIIDLINQKVIVNSKEINITRKEFQLLSILVNQFENSGSYITKKKIYSLIYNDKNDNSRIIDQLVFRLKQKIGKDFFEINKQGIKII